MTTAPLTHAPKIAFALAFAAVLSFGLLAGTPTATAGPHGQADAEPAPPTTTAPRTTSPQIEWDDSEGTLRHVVADTPIAPSNDVDVVVRQPADPGLVLVCVRPPERLRVSGDDWHRQSHRGDPTWCTEARAGSDVRFDLEEN
jgi:hypothetical protein